VPQPQVTESGPFAEHLLRTTLEHACRHADVDHRGAQLIHVTVNAIFRLASAPIIVRIAASPSLMPKVERVVAAAKWLERQGVAAVRLSEIDQPLLVRETGHVVTFWQYLSQTEAPPSAGDLAKPLRSLHSLPMPQFNLPRWDPLPTARARVDACPDTLLTAQERRWFADYADMLNEELDSLSFPLKRSVIHGDAYVGNLLRDQNGAAVLCDLDSLCFGPPEWDLIPELVGHIRYHRPSIEYQRLVDAYGFDPRSWPGHQTLLRVREYLVLTSVLPVLDSSPGIAAEFHHRIRSLRDGDHEAQWTPFGRAA
jgi:hypothetical protein